MGNFFGKPNVINLQAIDLSDIDITAEEAENIKVRVNDDGSLYFFNTLDSVGFYNVDYRRAFKSCLYNYRSRLLNKHLTYIENCREFLLKNNIQVYVKEIEKI